MSPARCLFLQKVFYVGGLLFLSMTGACKNDQTSGRAPLVVFAASSLTDVFVELEPIFEARYTDVDLQFSFSGSQVLRLQVEQGAPADVFASANQTHMSILQEKNLVTKTTHFASNELTLLVSTRLQAKLRTFSDLPKAKKIVLGAQTVPVGKYARIVLDNAKKKFGDSFERQVMQHVVSMESNARILRAKVELGEADAAIVYKTDAQALFSRRDPSSSVEKQKSKTYTIDIPEEINVAGKYFVAPIRSGPQQGVARRWIDFLQGEDGVGVLRSFGFRVQSSDAP